MAGDDWCDVMDMAKVGCAHCRPPAQRQRFAAVERDLTGPHSNSAPHREVRPGAHTHTPVVAQFGGRCEAGCGRPLRQGDEIARYGHRGWAHLECVEHAD